MAYASLADLDASGLPPGALGSVPRSVQSAMLQKASDFADSYLGDKFTLPLSPPYDAALVDAVCQIACWRLLVLRGFSPENPGDGVVRQGFLDARDWLTRIANGQATLKVRQANPASNQPDISSNEPRGYGSADGATDVPVIGTNWGT